MNSILTRRLLTDTIRFADRNWYYDFEQLPKDFGEAKCAERAGKLSKQYAELLRGWDDQANSEWVCRHYLAGKMILAATIQLTSRSYAQSRNLRVVDYYLAYYALLSLMRAVIFTLPNVDWDGGRIVTLSHRKLANLCVDAVSRFDSDRATRLQELIDETRASRELVSYWHPSSGDAGAKVTNSVIETCRLLAELAQFHSEILESSCHKRKIFGFKFLDEYILELSRIELHNHVFFDHEDAYRLDYMARKYPIPGNIKHILTEGHVDSFLSSWQSDDDEGDVYDPDENPWIIFDLN
jgi:hypothetical protein